MRTRISVHACGNHEEVAATRISDHLVVIDEHPLWASFAPCDLVWVAGEEYVRTVERAATYAVVAYFATDVTDDTIDASTARWNAVGYASRIGDAEVMVTSYNSAWLADVVASDPAVLWMDLLRRPPLGSEADCEE